MYQQKGNKTTTNKFSIMKAIEIMSKSELIEYLKELQPTLRWNFNEMPEMELRECIRMHFSA